MLPDEAVLTSAGSLPGSPDDAYHKLIAWLAHMAESDNVPLDTSIFVKQLTTTVCSHDHAPGSNGINSLGGNGGGGHGGERERGAGGRTTKAVASRQSSASCESRASSSTAGCSGAGRYSYPR